MAKGYIEVKESEPKVKKKLRSHEEITNEIVEDVQTYFASIFQYKMGLTQLGQSDTMDAAKGMVDSQITPDHRCGFVYGMDSSGRTVLMASYTQAKKAWTIYHQ